MAGRGTRWLGPVLAAGLWITGPAIAQQLPLATGQPVGGILTLDTDRLYQSSKFGQQMLTDVNQALKTLQTENKDIEAALEEEERKLTDERATMAPDAFRELAAAFDTKVKGIRAARDAKARDLSLQRDAAQKKFFEAAVPVLAAIMAERGAGAIINRSAIVLSFDRVDITDLAIARVDAALAKTDQAGPAPADPAPAGPDPAPDPAQPPAGGD